MPKQTLRGQAIRPTCDCDAAYCPSCTPSRLTGCIAVSIEPVAFASVLSIIRVPVAFEQPIQGRHSSAGRMMWDGRVSRSAPEDSARHKGRWRRADANHSLSTSPRSCSASRKRTEAGAPTAQPKGFACGATRLGARPNPSVVQCRSAVRLSDWNAVSYRARPPNPALQPTAARARSLVF